MQELQQHNSKSLEILVFVSSPALRRVNFQLKSIGRINKVYLEDDISFQFGHMLPCSWGMYITTVRTLKANFHLPRGVGLGGGFFLACEDLGRMFVL